MNRKPWWILVLVCFYAGCATHPPSETQAVVSRIARERPEVVSCKIQYIRLCEADVDGRLSCRCAPRIQVLGQ